MTTAGYSDPLRLVNRGRLGEDQLVELAETISDLPSVEFDITSPASASMLRMKPRSPL
jgi:hypothetical protein